MKTVELEIECSGLSGSGIDCVIGEDREQRGKIVINKLSDKSFPVLIVSRSSPPVPTGNYPFTLSAICADDGSCYKD